MPVYDYLCASCGPFADMRPMAECELPHDCPACGEPAQRALLTAPHLATMDSGRRKAFATNERSASAPKSLKQMTSKHGPGCGCCSGKKSMRYTRRGKDGSKSFPAGRPWMISH
jgi:putative FmdB family regulatory protein